MPPVGNVFLPTAPVPKSTHEVDFAVALAPCIRKGHEATVAHILQELTEARRTAVASLDPTRTISSAEMVTSDARKYLALVRGFRMATREPTGPALPAAADGLPSAVVDVETPEAAAGAAAANEAEEQKLRDAAKAKVEAAAKAKEEEEAKAKKESKGAGGWFGFGGNKKENAAVGGIEGTGEDLGDDAPVPALPIGGGTDHSGGKGGGSAAAASAATDGGDEQEGQGGKKAASGKKQYEATSPPVVDGSLRHMVAFTWRDLGDSGGCMFRLGDTVLEEASVLLALSQVLLQKAKAEPLSDLSMLDVFKWLKQASGTLGAALACVKEAGAPLDHCPDDLKNGLVTVLVDCSLAQAQHVTIRRAQVTMASNKAITHALIAKLCHDTAERYKSMEGAARGLCESADRAKSKEGVATYVMAHLRYKQLYFLGLAYAMVGLERISSDPTNLGYGIRDMLTAKDLFGKAELAAKKFIDSARSLVFVDNLTILHGLNDCLDQCTAIIDQAAKENDTVYFKPVPERPDMLPDRMSNIRADLFETVATSPLWTPEVAAAFDPAKAPKLHIGKVPEMVDCCPAS